MTNQTAKGIPLPLTIVEPITLDEVAAIAELYPTKSVAEKRAMIEESLAPNFAASLKRKRTILLASVAEVLVGTVQVVWEDSTEEPELLPPGAAVIQHLRTHPDYRRRGSGRRLMEAAERCALDAGVSRLTLGVEPFNEVARRFYEQLGFSEFLRYHDSEGNRIIGMRKCLTRP